MSPKPVSRNQNEQYSLLADGIDIKGNIGHIFEGKQVLFQQKIKAAIKEYDNANDTESKSNALNKILQILKPIKEDILKSLSGNPNLHSRLFIRFGLFCDSWLKTQNIEFFSNYKIELINNIGDNSPYFYLDEWLVWVSKGNIKPSKIEDVSAKSKKNENAKLMSLKTSLQNEKRNISVNITNRDKLLSLLNNLINSVLETKISESELDNGPPYNIKINNTKTYENIRDIMTKLQAVERYITSTSEKVNKISDIYNDMKSKLGDDAGNQENFDTIFEELDACSQMMKMCVGPRGNSFPFAHSQYIGMDIINRHILKIKINEFVTLDSEIFYWKFQGIESHRCPYIILLPAYADQGICWEPIDFANRATGRGKIAIPIFPSSATIDEVILTALADYRWQKEKELLGSYWMNEGITGNYYMYHESLKKQKRKGTLKVKFNKDLKKSFIDDYILWMRFESKGMQKLTKEARAIFWNHIPFPEELRDSLKDRGYHFKVLWENDQRKKQSRGY